MGDVDLDEHLPLLGPTEVPSMSRLGPIQVGRGTQRTTGSAPRGKTVYGPVPALADTPRPLEAERYVACSVVWAVPDGERLVSFGSGLSVQ